MSPPGIHVTTSVPSATFTPESASRKCSLIQEESIEEDDEDMDINELHQTKSLEDYLSDDSDARSVGERSSGRSHGSPTSAPPHTRRTSPMKPLHSVRSSPQLLKQIYEEGESDDDLSLLPKKKMHSPRCLSKQTSPDLLSKLDSNRKKRFSHKHRGTSCSSSDASDTDETDTRRRKEKLKHRFHRRDSSDHSSDTDGPSGVGPSGGGGGGSLNGAKGQRTSSGSSGSDKGSKNNENKNRNGKSGKERKQCGFTKQNLGNLTLGVKDENLPPEKERKISNISIGSGISNLSLTSLNSRSGKYLSPRRESEELLACEVDVLNEENKARTHVIHVRSKEFSDLMDKFRPGASDRDDSSSTSSKASGIKFRRRAKDKKMDINRNENDAARNEDMDCDMDMSGHTRTQVPKAKCCSVV